MTAWVKIPSPAGDKFYYWNPAQSRTIWALPDGEVCDWQAATTPEGKTYYYNGQGRTVWDPPNDEPPPAAKSNISSSLPGLDLDDWLRSYTRPQRGWLFTPLNSGSSLSSDSPAPGAQTACRNQSHAGVGCSENWVEVQPEDGASYFWNFAVGMSARQLPQGVRARWSMHRTLEGHSYFVDRESSRSVWRIPGMPDQDTSSSSTAWIEPGAAMSITDLQQDSCYNGHAVHILGFQDRRVLAKLPDALGGTVLCLKPENLQPLTRGTIVEFCGLSAQSAASLNGEVGTVDGLDKECRYLVKMRDGKVKSAKGVKLCPRSRLWDIDLQSHSSELQWRHDKKPSLFIDSQGQHNKYTLHFPLNFRSKQQEAQNGHDVAPKWPLLVFMHGAGGGQFFAHAKKLLSSEGLQFAASHFLVLSPHCNWGWRDAPKAWVTELIQYFRALSFVDHRRVYLTGISMGGMGTWEVAAERPDLFAAVAPVAAYHQASRTEFIAWRLQHTSLCAVYSMHDDRCPVRNEVPLWEKLYAGGNDKLRIQIAPEIDHGSMYEKAYCDDATLFEWLLRFAQP